MGNRGVPLRCGRGSGNPPPPPPSFLWELFGGPGEPCLGGPARSQLLFLLEKGAIFATAPLPNIRLPQEERSHLINERVPVRNSGVFVCFIRLQIDEKTSGGVPVGKSVGKGASESLLWEGDERGKEWKGRRAGGLGCQPKQRHSDHGGWATMEGRRGQGWGVGWGGGAKPYPDPDPCRRALPPPPPKPNPRDGRPFRTRREGMGWTGKHGRRRLLRLGGRIRGRHTGGRGAGFARDQHVWQA